jgi:PiT family inorganic phosphate transporter
VTVAELAAPDPLGEPNVEVSTGALVTSRAEDAPTSPTVGDLARGESPPEEPADEPPEIPDIGEEGPPDLDRKSLFDPSAVKRIAALWVLTPTLAVAGSYPLFLVVL